MRQYEFVLVIRPTLEDEQVNALVAQYGEMIAKGGGEILSAGQLVDKKGNVADTSGGWAKRRLAYPISGHREGYYSVTALSGPPELVERLESAARLSEDVLRYQTIRTGDED